jgi:NAD(P)-dependent dehydrogenase (short-subunit alcohol dehydrogenase family)
MLAGRREGVLAAAVEELRAGGADVDSFTVDIRDPDRVQQLVETTARRFNGLDILVNNAGGQFPKATEQLSVNGWKAVVDTNLNGTFYVTQAFGKELIRRGKRGVITNILISFLHRGSPGIAHSVAARNGVFGLTRTLGAEWAKYGIRINAVGPGLIVTPGMEEEMAAAAPANFLQRTILGTPAKRGGRPEEVAWLVTFLSSAAADYITGEFIVMDGGNSLAGGVSFEPV